MSEEKLNLLLLLPLLLASVQLQASIKRDKSCLTDAPKGKKVYCSADACSINSSARVNSYRGHVKVIQGKSVLTAEYIVSYGDVTGSIVKWVAIGHPASYRAILAHKNIRFVATARTLYYYPQQERLEAIGDATITRGQTYLKGPNISYDFAKKLLETPFSKKGHTEIAFLAQ